jgi:hypothetical protein
MRPIVVRGVNDFLRSILLKNFFRILSLFVCPLARITPVSAARDKRKARPAMHCHDPEAALKGKH